MSIAKPIAYSSPILLVPLPRGAIAIMSGEWVVRGKERQAPAPQGPCSGGNFLGLVVDGCVLSLWCVLLCLMCLAEPSVYAM
jgi:hypothetical protein